MIKQVSVSFVAFIFGFLLVTPTFAVTTSQIDSALKSCNEAAALYQKGKLYRASAAFSKCVERAGNLSAISPDIFVLAAKVFSDTDKDYLARKVLSQIEVSAITKPETLCVYYAVQAKESLNKSVTAEAIDYANHAIDISDRNCGAARAIAHVVKSQAQFFDGNSEASGFEFQLAVQEPAYVKEYASFILRHNLSTDSATENFKKTAAGLTVMADKLNAENKYVAADAMYAKAIKKDPDFLLAYVNRARNEEDRDNLPATLPYYTAATKIDPYYNVPYANAAFMLYQLVQQNKRPVAVYETAKQYLSKSIALDPEYFRAYNTRGAIFSKQKKSTAAIQDYKMAIQLSSVVPGIVYPKAHANLASEYYAQGDTEMAKKYYEEALAIQSDYTLALTGLGDVLRDEGLLEQALSKFAAALTSAPTDESVAFSFVQTAEDLQKYDEAIEVALAMSKVYPRNVTWYQFLANLYILKGEDGMAEPYKQKAIQLNPSLKNAYLLDQAQALFDAEKSDASKLILNKIIASEPKNDAAIYLLSQVYAQKMDYLKSRELINMALVLKKNDPLYLYALGFTYRKTNECDKAIDTAKKALLLSTKLTPKYVVSGIYDDVVFCYAKKGDMVTAEQYALKGLEEFGDDVALLANLGYIYGNTNRTSDAIAMYKKILDIDPQEEIALNSLRILGVIN